jgi:hypothetical protein
MLTRGKCLATGPAVACLLLMSAGGASARCTVPNFTFWLGHPASATMRADSGVPCNINVWQGIGSDFRSVTTARAPAQGAVSRRDDRNFVYRSRAGFQGSDSFVIAISGTKFGEEKKTELTVNVQVAAAKPGAHAGNVAPAVARPSTVRTPAPVQAQQPAQSKKQRAAAPQGQPNALLAKCLQQVGAGKDPVTGRWMIYTGETDSLARGEAFKLCLAGGDRAKANQITLPSINLTHPGDRHGLPPVRKR